MNNKNIHPELESWSLKEMLGTSLIVGVIFLIGIAVNYIPKIDFALPTGARIMVVFWILCYAHFHKTNKHVKK